MTTWYVRKSGSNANGGTSASIRSSGADGCVSLNALTKVSALSAVGVWSATDIGQAVNINGRIAAISAYTANTALTVTTFNASASITSSGLFTAAMVGTAISGPGIPSGAYLNTFVNSSSMTMNLNAGAGFGTGTAVLAPVYTCATTLTTSASNGTWTVGGAFLTVGQFLTLSGGQPQPGDSCYIGAGVYREVNTVAISGSAGNPISIIGDVQGAVTGDPGEVQITNYLNGDMHISMASTILSCAATTNLTFSSLTIIEGASIAAVSASAGSQNVSFADCTIITQNGGSFATVTSSTTGLPLNWTFDRCALVSLGNGNGISLSLTTTASGAGDWDANVVLRNCLVMGQSAEIQVAASGSAVHKGGGVRAYGCTFFVGNIQALNVNSALVSSTIPCEMHGCVVVGGIGVQANVAGQVVEDHNLFFCATPRTNVAVGPGSISNFSYAPLFDIGQAYKVSGVARPFMSPSSAISTLLAFGAQSLADAPFSGPPRAGRVPPGIPGWQPPPNQLNPTEQIGAQVPIQTYDWANRPRPAGTQSNLPTVGYMEYHDSAVQDTVTYDVGPSSAKLVGPADIDLLMPVDAVSNTVSVRVLYDTAYQGQNFPTVTMLANGGIGVTAQTVAAVSNSYGSWQTVTLGAVTPTAAGVVKIRLASYDLSGVSAVHFDTIAVA